MATIEQISDYVQLTAKTASDVTSGCMEWTGFLKTAARLYCYSFTDQILIRNRAPGQQQHDGAPARGCK